MATSYNLREFKLPDGVPGKLFGTSMPGLYSRDFEADRAVIQESGVDTVICLNPLAELIARSPTYARALQSQSLPWKAIHFPIPDLDVPGDRDALLQLVSHVASGLREGDWIAVHCAAGIGRTGLFGALVLVALGERLDRARETVRAAGSFAETQPQLDLLDWAAKKLAGRG